MTRQEAARIVAVILASYPTQAEKLLNPKRQVAMVEAFESLLSDVSYEHANAAVRALVQTSKFMPSIAEIRASALELVRGPVRAGVDAWGDLRQLRAFRDRDAMTEVDPLVLQVCQRYGWIEWRTYFRGSEDIEQWHVVTSEHEASDRARFAELYDKLASQAQREAQSPLLAAAREAREGGAASALVADVAKQLSAPRKAMP